VLEVGSNSLNKLMGGQQEKENKEKMSKSMVKKS
jgi:hypothetical protein